MTVSHPAVVGRDREQALIDALLRRVRDGDGGALTLCGEPGSGKTTLLALARGVAEDCVVVGCRGVEFEAELPFSGLHELLAPFAACFEALPVPQRDALEGALGLKPSDAPRLLNVHAGVLTLLSELSRRQPVLVLIDDLQWVDSASRNALAFVARRCEQEPIAVLAATRPEAARALGAGAVEEVDGLAADAARALVEQLLGAAAPDEVVADLVSATGGNPLAIAQAVAYLGDRALRRGSPLDEPLPLGALLDLGFADELDRLSPDGRCGVELVAASLSRDAVLLWDAARVAGLPEHALREPLDTSVLQLEHGDFEFAHPVLRSLVHRTAPPERWRRWHAALAEVTPSAALQAWHRATAAPRPDAAVADALDEAAVGFTRRGGAIATAQALARAGELSPDRDVGARRLVRAGRAAMYAHRPNWARELLLSGRGRARTRRARLRADHELLIHEMLFGAPDRVPPYDELAKAAVEEGDVTLALDAAAHAVNDAGLRGDPRIGPEILAWLEQRLPPQAQEDHADDLAALGAECRWLYPGGLRVGDPHVEVLLATARTATARANREPTRPLSEGLDDYWVAGPLLCVECYDEANALLSTYVEACHKQAAAHLLEVCLNTRASLNLRLGDWVAAAQDLAEAARIGQMGGVPEWGAMTTAWQCYLDGCQTGVDVRDRLVEGRAMSQASGFHIYEEYAGGAEGAALLAAGDPDGAAAVLEGVRNWKHRAEQVEPSTPMWWPDLIDAHLSAGHHELAAERTAELREFAQLASRRWAMASVLWFEGALADDDAFESLFEASLEEWVHARMPFPAARTRLAFGNRLQRLGRRDEAAAQFALALAEFDRLGAEPWAARARRALGQPAARRGPRGGREPDALTPQERQVAQLVARGATNKEAAGELFVTPKTIEAHLSRIYRKLGVTSRTQLAARWPERDA